MDIENFIKTIQPPIYKRLVHIQKDVAEIFGIENILLLTGEFTYITQILPSDKDIVLTSEMCNLLDCSTNWQGLSLRDLVHGRDKIYPKPQSIFLGETNCNNMNLPKLQCEFLKRALKIGYANLDADSIEKKLANDVLINTSEMLARSFRKYFKCPFSITTDFCIKDNSEIYVIYQDEKIIGGIKDLKMCKKIINKLNIIVQSCIDLNDLHIKINEFLHLNLSKFTYRPIYRFEILKLYKI